MRLESVIPYMLTIQERLERFHNIVCENLEQAQPTQNEWYDRHTWNREFQPISQVLVCFRQVPINCWPSGRGPTL